MWTNLFNLVPADVYDKFIKWLVVFVFGLFGITVQLGCGPDQNAIERQTTSLMKDVVEPAITKAIGDLRTTTGNVSGTATAIEPGYDVNFEGFWVVGVKGKIEVRAKGVSGTLMGNVQGETAPPGSAAIAPKTIIPATKEPDDKGVIQ